MPKSNRFHPIDRPAQLRALASPLRQELLDVLEASGPCSIGELAAPLGRAPDSLYFHVRRLQKVGLVVEVERRAVGRHTVAIYDVAGRPLRIDRTKARPAELQAVVAGILRLATRDHRCGLTDPGTVHTGPARNHWGGRVRGWLDDRDLATANRLLERLLALMRRGRPGAGRQPIALSWVFARTPPRRRTGRSAP
jgi:DNA-binding transcriptional ArsR family regulator